LSAIPSSTKIAGIFLHAANLQHGADSFTSLPKQGMMWNFSHEKSDGFSQI
jgi:hypothetical protein